LIGQASNSFCYATINSLPATLGAAFDRYHLQDEKYLPCALLSGMIAATLSALKWKDA
jgi:hypothetical protein